MSGKLAGISPGCRPLWVAAVVLTMMTIAVAAPAGDERFLVPQEDPGGPFYARIEPGVILHTDEWAAIAFYRETYCVPDDFNLLDFYHVPNAFFCPLTVHGFVIYKNPAPSPPAQSKLQGNGAVPIWFVRWNELGAAVADGVLTKDEILALPSLLKGEARFFEETLHPSDGAQRGMLELNAFGYLPDGRSFDFQAVGVMRGLTHVRIEFK